MICAWGLLLASLMHLPIHWHKTTSRTELWLYILWIIVITTIATYKTRLLRLTERRDAAR
jgi:hypothetical protein